MHTKCHSRAGAGSVIESARPRDAIVKAIVGCVRDDMDMGQAIIGDSLAY
jgi:hypothetical protein